MVDFAIDVAIGLALSAPVAAIAVRRRSVTGGGATAGVLVGGITYAGMYLGGLMVLGVALALTAGSTRIGRGRKVMSSTGHDDEPRGAGSIIANCLIGTIAAAIEASPVNIGLPVTAVWFVAAIAAGSSDTVSSEIGQALSARPRRFPTFERVPSGTPGAISLPGTAAGLAAASVIAAPAAALWLISWSAVPAIAIACLAGSMVESTLSTLLEERGSIGNNVLNLLNTAVAAAVAVLMLGTR